MLEARQFFQLCFATTKYIIYLAQLFHYTDKLMISRKKCMDWIDFRELTSFDGSRKTNARNRELYSGSVQW